MFDSLFPAFLEYRKNSKNWDTENYYNKCPKSRTVLIHNAIMRQKDGDGMANSVDPDQTAPFGAA